MNLPFGLGKIDFIADEVQQRAAWELYVELRTRIATQPLFSKDKETGTEEYVGLLREALDSLYRMFSITRDILRKAGPEVADGADSFGPLAIDILNEGLRPFTAKWHPLLLQYEEQRPEDVDRVSWEARWEHEGAMREDLVELQRGIQQYAEVLAIISGAELIDGGSNKQLE